MELAITLDYNLSIKIKLRFDKMQHIIRYLFGYSPGHNSMKYNENI